MDARQIKAFIDAMAASDLAEMEVSHEGWTLRLSRTPSATPVKATTQRVQRISEMARPADDGPHLVTAPMFGLIHLQPAPGEPPFVKAGDTVEAGTVLCTIEAMKVFNEVRAERSGRLTAVHVASGVEVEAGQALFSLDV